MQTLASEEATVGTVLLVEDDYPSARLVQLAFDDVAPEIEVDVAQDGQAALDTLLGADDPGTDVVLLDLDLPDIHGTDVLAELRDTEATTRLPVVVFSSNRDQETIDRCYALGASTYIVKPDDYAGLVDLAIQVSSYWGATRVALPSAGH